MRCSDGEYLDGYQVEVGQPIRSMQEMYSRLQQMAERGKRMKYAVVKKTKVYVSDNYKNAEKCAKYLKERDIIFGDGGTTYDYVVEEIL